MVRAARLSIVVVLVAAAGGIAFWLGSRPDRVAVEVVLVDRGLVEEIATNSRAGTVAARRRAKLSPELGGRVVSLPKRAGDWVAADEVLLALDTTLERGEVALRSREAEVAAAQAEQACLAADRAKREHQRNQELARQELVSADSIDRLASGAREAAAACDATRAAHQAASAARELARQAVDKRTLRAPFAGLIAELSIEVGEWTTPSPPAMPVPPVIDLLDPNSLYVSLPMDEVDAGRLTAGLPARLTIDSLPDQSFAARVVRVAPYVLDLETQNRTVEIEVELVTPAAPSGSHDNPARSPLLPGTSADVEVILAAHDDVMRVPTNAVLAGDRVLVVRNGQLAEQTITTGLGNWELVEVTSGLEVGDQVVVSLDRPEISAGAVVGVVTVAKLPARRAADPS